MRSAALAPLAALERSRLDGGPQAAQPRLALLRQLAHTRLAKAGEVLRLHEALCFLRAYPGSAEVLALVQAMLERFAERADLRAHRVALADTGIAGTAIHYRFFAGQAQWLARRWPVQLRLDRDDRNADAAIARALPLLQTPAEAQALVAARLPGYQALDRLRGEVTDAAFLLQRIAALPGTNFTREAFSDAVDASYVVVPGAGTPSRTAAHFSTAPSAIGHGALLLRGRPDLRAELARPPRALRRLGAAPGGELADLAQAAMVTRARSLEAFAYADARDAWLVDDGDGLAYGMLGMLPERRHAIAALYGGLTLRNGVPVGYLQADIVGRSAALSFNTFDTFRGGEAAHTFARWLAALHRMFGSTSFTIEPYQLGKGNDEGLASGAWWFYFKLGFRPRDAAVARLARAELARMARRPGHRSSPATLRRLADAHLYFDLDPTRPHPLPPLAALGLRAGAALSARAGADRERAVDEASAELMRRCGMATLRGFRPTEREAWRRWAPVVALLDVERWPEADRHSLVDLIRAKGGRSERDHVARMLAHPRLEAALLAAGAAL